MLCILEWICITNRKILLTVFVFWQKTFFSRSSNKDKFLKIFFYKRLFFHHFICYLYEGQNKTKKFCFQGCRSRIFCTTYNRGRTKNSCQKGFGNIPKIQNQICHVWLHTLWLLFRENGRQKKLIIRTVFTAVFCVLI